MNSDLAFVSLFSGVGGLDLGLERAGWTCAGQVEINPKAQAVLAKHWPDVPRWSDVRDVGRHNLPPARLLCGGFPCQDVSVSGRRKGLAGDRSSLWSEFARIISETQPRWIVVENVLGLLSVDTGRFFGTVLRDLASSGYDAVWNVLRASDFGALHRRERVILVAHRDGERIERFFETTVSRVETFSWCKDVRGIEDLRGRPDIPQPLVRRMEHGSAFRVDAVGNAVLPDLGEWIGRRIIEIRKAALS